MVANIFIKLKLHTSSARFEIKSASSHAFRFSCAFKIQPTDTTRTDRRLVIYVINLVGSLYSGEGINLNYTFPLNYFLEKRP